MKTHTTNYTNSFIEAAEDCPAEAGIEPPVRGDKKSIANLQFDILRDSPYKHTSDDVLFQVYAIRNDLTESELPSEREKFFSKGQACLRASPLTKSYGWGIHSDHNGNVALYGCDTEKYKDFTERDNLKVLKAMRSKRK